MVEFLPPKPKISMQNNRVRTIFFLTFVQNSSTLGKPERSGFELNCETLFSWPLLTQFYFCGFVILFSMRITMKQDFWY